MSQVSSEIPVAWYRWLTAATQLVEDWSEDESDCLLLKALDSSEIAPVDLLLIARVLGTRVELAIQEPLEPTDLPSGTLPGVGNGRLGQTEGMHTL